MSERNRLPDYMIWQQRPFPDSNLLLIDGKQPTLVDSGFVAHAKETVDWAQGHAGRVHRVVNTHWHSDHVGANSLLQSKGVVVSASTLDADALSRRDRGCCAAEYLDQPVAPYTVDEPLTDNDIVQLGDTDWQVVATPGHTAGHIALWQPEDRVLMVGDTLSDYDVGWVNRALDGPDIAAVAASSLRRLAQLEPLIVMPAHGRIPDDPAVAFSDALRRADRLVADPDGALWYGIRRIFAFALMIRGGISVADVEPYLHRRMWLTDAARQLRTSPELLSSELVSSMVRGNAIVVRSGVLRAAAVHTEVSQRLLDEVTYPRQWPPVTSST